ncbi:MAG: oligosaccharide flippase family protein [Hydrogenophaga sp.]|uniref:oligosaccharide flippase family protein n=1 Tax=Hydrogenophaga sp. TaxID=1904254 RepID=UPI0025B949E1|nr:oligosaccharide flippase family protein [Hydrogenophaga sp.]MBT9551402.1 oligosaccharide flippase family protein [Hydrogenophaga sp.]
MHSKHKAEGLPGKLEAASFSDRARSGTIWIVVAFGGGQILRLAANIALAALLFEEAFALMAIVSAVMMGLAMFSDIGLKPSVVQNPRGDEPVFLQTAWTLQVLRGLVLFICAVLLAWPMARIYGANDPIAKELMWLIPLVAFGAITDGLQSSRMLSAARQMDIASVTKIEMLVQLSNAVLMVGLAWYLRSVYALAFAGLASSALRLWLSYALLPGRPEKFRLDREAVRAIFRFGKWIFLSTLISFLAIQIDRVLLAAIFPLAEVGVYSIAASLALMVTVLNGALQSAIVFPWYSRMLDKGIPLQDAFKRTRVPLLVVVTFLVALLVNGASSFFELAYDHRYVKGGDFLPVLAVGVWFSSLSGIYGSAFLAMGKSQWIAKVSAIKVSVFLLFLLVYLQFDYSIEMAVLAVLSAEVIATATSQYLGWKVGLRNLRVEILLLFLLLAAVAAGWWFVQYVPWVAVQPPFVRLLLLGLLQSCFFAPLAHRFVLAMFRRSVT